jgi:hypothetical protein
LNVIEHKKSIFHCSVVKADRQPDTMLKCSSSFVNEYCFIKKMNDFAVHESILGKIQIITHHQMIVLFIFFF